MFKGPYNDEVTAGADSAILAKINEKVLVTTPASGSLGDLTKALFASIASTIIGVVDFGRGEVTVWKHSTNNFTRVVNAVNVSAEVLILQPSSITEGSPGWTLSDGTNSLGDTVSPYAEDPDSRSAVAKGLAEVFAPSPSSLSAAALIERVTKVLEANNKEGFLVINDQDKSFRLFVMDDTSALTAHRSASLASTDANSFGGVFSVPAVVSNTTGGSVI